MLLFSSSLSPLWSHDQIMLSRLSCLLLEMLLLSESAWDIFAPQLCVLISLYQHVLPQQHYFKNAALFPPLSPTPCITFPRFKRHRLRYFPGGTAVKESACNAGDWGSIPGSGRSPGGEGMATCSSILAWRIPKDRGAWWATVRHDWSDLAAAAAA